MRRYAAFLRGVSPMNAKMPAVAEAFASAGFADVRTLLSSGNVVFSARPAPAATLARRAEAAMERRLGAPFLTIVREVEALRALLVADPYEEFRIASGAKRVVTFLRGEPSAVPRLPLALDDARILCVRGAEVFSVYVPGPRGPTFMRLIEKTFGQDVTTRTWDTVRKVAR